MIGRRFLGSSALRLAAAFALVFGLGGAIMFGAVQWMVDGYATGSLEVDLRVETDVLLADGAANDLPLLRRRIDARAGIASPFAYALFDGSGRRLGGELSGAAPAAPGLNEVSVPAPSDDGGQDDEPIIVRTLATSLPVGTLVVGKSTHAVHELQEWMSRVALWGAVGMLTLALAGGLAAGLLLARRVDRLNAATTRIMQGHVGDRLPPIGLGSEFATLRDNLNSMLDRLEASLEAMRHVSSDIAHDLRTPLNRMRQRLEHAREHASTVADLQGAIDEAIEDLDGALSVFAALLRIAQIEAGTGRETFAEVSASGLVQRVFDAYQPVAEEAGHTLLVRPEGEQTIMGDAGLLAQMMSNLVENSIVHADGPISITIASQDVDRGTIISVTDTGRGIPDAALPKVARRFYRVDRSRQSPGSGLGLALVAAIASLHDARFELRHNFPGLVARVEFAGPDQSDSATNVMARERVSAS